MHDSCVWGSEGMQGCKHLLQQVTGFVLLHSLIGLQHLHPWVQHLYVTRVSTNGWLSLWLCNLLQLRRDMAEGASWASLVSAPA